MLQLVNEIRSFSEVLYNRSVLKNFSKFTDKLKKIYKNFAKFTEKYICQNLFFNKVAGWKPETVRSSQWICSVKQDQNQSQSYSVKKVFLEIL